MELRCKNCSVKELPLFNSLILLEHQIFKLNVFRLWYFYSFVSRVYDGTFCSKSLEYFIIAVLNSINVNWPLWWSAVIDENKAVLTIFNLIVVPFTERCGWNERLISWILKIKPNFLFFYFLLFIQLLNIGILLITRCQTKHPIWIKLPSYSI